MPRRKRAPISNGRPKIEIDWDWVDKQLEAGCIGTEIASGLKMHPHTFYDRVVQEKGLSFTDYSKQKAGDGERLLRRKQQDVALSGNVPMLIWLGKQRLGQREPDSKPVDDVAIKKAAEELLKIREFLFPALEKKIS